VDQAFRTRAFFLAERTFLKPGFRVIQKLPARRANPFSFGLMLPPAKQPYHHRNRLFFSRHLAHSIIEILSLQGSRDLEDAEIGKDQKRGSQAEKENPARFKDTAGFGGKDFGHNVKQAHCDADRL
jgi:hypothetical protein